MPVVEQHILAPIVFPQHPVLYRLTMGRQHVEHPQRISSLVHAQFGPAALANAARQGVAFQQIGETLARIRRQQVHAADQIQAVKRIAGRQGIGPGARALHRPEIQSIRSPVSEIAHDIVAQHFHAASPMRLGRPR
jgi:hypothetical protein